MSVGLGNDVTQEAAAGRRPPPSAAAVANLAVEASETQAAARPRTAPVAAATGAPVSSAAVPGAVDASQAHMPLVVPEPQIVGFKQVFV